MVDNSRVGRPNSHGIGFLLIGAWQVIGFWRVPGRQRTGLEEGHPIANRDQGPNNYCVGHSHQTPL